MSAKLLNFLPTNKLEAMAVVSYSIVLPALVQDTVLLWHLRI